MAGIPVCKICGKDVMEHSLVEVNECTRKLDLIGYWKKGGD